MKFYSTNIKNVYTYIYTIYDINNAIENNETKIREPSLTLINKSLLQNKQLYIVSTNFDETNKTGGKLL